MKIFHLILLSVLFFLPVDAVQASGETFPENTVEDTITYRGYRLNLYNFEVLKKTDDWIKVRFSTVNTGRMDIKMDEATMHWVQFNFDQSLFEKKLGGFRENIRFQMAQDGFKLAIGELREKVDLKFPTILPKEYEKASAHLSDEKDNTEKVPAFTIPTTTAESPSHPELTERGGDSTAEAIHVPVRIEPEPEACPDIRFESLRIIEENDKWATLEYTIVNDGEAPFQLAETEKGKGNGLVIRAYISGVTTLSRGALPVGGEFIEAAPGVRSKLKKGERFQSNLKLDVRKKTRYMKSLILKLDGAQYAKECDRTNNTGAVILR